MDGPERMLTRQAFVHGALASAAGFAFGLPPAEGAASYGTVEIAPGLFVHRGRHALSAPENAGDIANASFIVGREAVAVVDTGGSARCGARLREAIRAVTDLPIRYVVNTHMHPDHVFGNAAFEADRPRFVGHAKLARALAARAGHYLAAGRAFMGEAVFEGTRIVMPTVEVPERLELGLGGRSLVLEAWPTAHTDNDLTVYDPQTDTLILADLLFSEHIPTLDGSLRGWLAVLDRLRERRAARVVPGHGPAAMPWPEAQTAERRYLDRLAAGVRAAIKAGRSIVEAAESAGREEEGAWLLFEEYHARNVTAAFAELEWE